AWAREPAKPRRYTTLSSRVSSRRSRFSPVEPTPREAFSKVLRNCFSSRPYARRAFCFSRSWSRYSLCLMRPRPCSPGGYERRSIAHFSVRQRSPLRKSLMPSRRHCLHFGERSRATVVTSRLDRAPQPRNARRARTQGAFVAYGYGHDRGRGETERCSALPGAGQAGGGHLNTPPLLLADAVVCLRRDVLHTENL